MTLQSILADLLTSPRPRSPRLVTLELSTAQCHMLPPAVLTWLDERALSWRKTWERQVIELWEADYEAFMRGVEVR